MMEQYIDKSAVVAEINSMLKSVEHTSHCDEASFNSGRWKALTSIKKFLDTLEVKNRNLKEELKGTVNGAMADAEKSLNKTNDKSDYICYKIFKYLKENM